MSVVSPRIEEIVSGDFDPHARKSAAPQGLESVGVGRVHDVAAEDLTTAQIRATLRYAAWLASQQSLRAS
jgi:hypothetical protein